MEKIPSVWQRNYDTDRLIRDEVVPEAKWVLDGEGKSTRKFDGTCCSIFEDGTFWKRHEVNHKKGKTRPEGFVPAGDGWDPLTGKEQGWVPVGDGPEDRWHREALENMKEQGFVRPGRYELCGPKVQGNPEGFDTHVLVPHGSEVFVGVPRDFEGMKEWLAAHDVEGIVFHHPDGRMAKVKKKDYGLKR